ncbi:MAG TPA: hypothetical protein VIX73_30735 [Kofleriaceae bacterium]|jgi:hypothetical protein
MKLKIPTSRYCCTSNPAGRKLATGRKDNRFEIGATRCPVTVPPAAADPRALRAHGRRAGRALVGNEIVTVLPSVADRMPGAPMHVGRTRAVGKKIIQRAAFAVSFLTAARW